MSADCRPDVQHTMRGGPLDDADLYCSRYAEPVDTIFGTSVALPSDDIYDAGALALRH